MSPLDDELRAAFRARARTLEPAPDPLAGIERRARSLQRRRVATSVAGTALAVSVLAVGVPAVVTGVVPDRDGVTATRPPAPSPSSRPFELDPASPWPYRGTADLGQRFLETAQREWQVRHPGSELVPLFGQVDEPSGRSLLVFLGRGDAQAADGLRWGVVTDGEGGPEFVHDVDLFPSDRLGLAVALPGDEAPRLLVVAAPGTTVDYGRAGGSPRPLSVLADGVATGPQDDVDGDYYVVRAPDGSVVKEVGAPDVRPSRAPGQDPLDPTAAVPPPDNLLGWPTRGAADPSLVREAEAAFARELDRTGQRVGSRVLFGGSDGDGRSYVLLQAWTEGDDAYTLGYATGPGREPRVALRGKSETDAPVLALLVPAGPEQAADTLVLVPRPGTGTVLYGPSASQLDEVVRPPELGGVALVDRPLDASGDLVRTLDAEGQTAFDGGVRDLLCTLRGCD
jgi:hypothetical protein